MNPSERARALQKELMEIGNGPIRDLGDLFDMEIAAITQALAEFYRMGVEDAAKLLEDRDDAGYSDAWSGVWAETASDIRALLEGTK